MRAEYVLNHPDGHRAGMRNFYKMLSKNADVTYNVLCDLDNIDQSGMEQMELLYRGYLSLFIEDYKEFSKPYTVNQERGCAAMHVFVEMSRLHFILQYQRLKDEKTQVLYDATIRDSFDTLLTFSFEKCQSEFWRNTSDPQFHNQSIMTYGQSKIIAALLHISKRMEEMPYTTEIYEDFNMLVLALFTRNSVLLCEACSIEAFDHLNMRTLVKDQLYTFNQDYIMLCTIYFNAIQRRLYYWNQFESLVLEVPEGIPTEKLESWFADDLLPGLGDEGFDDIFNTAMDNGYDFVGDKEWFVYRYPQRVVSKGPVLDCIRPVEAQQYFNAPHYSKDVTLGLSRGHRSDFNGKVGRRFVLLAIDQYFRNHHNIGWYDAVVVNNDDIEDAELKLCKSPFPCFLQVLGDYWVYLEGNVYVCDNIYTSFGLWLYLIHKKYNNWFHTVNIKYLIKALFK